MARVCKRALVVAAMLVGGGAAASPPYQLCHTQDSGAPAAIAPEQNYRFPPSATVRHLGNTVRDRCDLPMSEAIDSGLCQWSYGDCGYRDQVRNDQCSDGDGWWLGISVLRSTHLAYPGDDRSPQTSPWPRNPAVQVHSHFPTTQRVERYRYWAWESPLAIEQSLGIQERRTVGGTYPRCYTMAHLFGFFNGVWNTRSEAEDSLEEIKKQDFIGMKWRDAPVRYELFYNQTCKRREDDVCLQDVAEVFRQRSAELDGLLARRWEYFWEQVTGQRDQPGSFTQRLLARLVRSDQALVSWFDGLYNATLAKITAISTLLADNPPTAEDTAAHTAQLIAAGQRGERAVLVAHSQGNLFVNAAYDAYLAHARAAGQAQGQDTRYVAAQVVHIAPASPTLRGPYVLADIDLVINGLRWVDGTYLAVSNFSLATDAKDRSGHQLLATYLDEARPARAHIRQLITQALDAL